jgi:DNA (cytosine-5)-methyltransferase 1
MERGKRSYVNMKMRIEKGKPLNLNDQINAISKGLLPTPMIGTPTAAMCRRSSKFAKGRMPNPAEYVQQFPTPQNRDFRCGQAERVVREGKQKNLNDFVKMWPTPRAGNPGSRPNGKGGKVLAEEAKKSLLPTPTANDAKNSLTESQAGRGTLTAHLVETGEATGGQLNADWVEALMGYPLGWTDIEKETLGLVNFPAAWLDGSWEEGIPRIITGQKNRVKRLKGLGNSVVPQIPALIWLLIKEFLLTHGECK